MRNENVSRPTKRLQKANKKCQAFPHEETFLFFLFFLKEPVACTPRHSCLEKISRKYSKIWPHRANNKWYLRSKVDNILKISTYEATSFFCTFTDKTANMRAVFLRYVDPNCLNTFSTSPCQAVDLKNKKNPAEILISEDRFWMRIRFELQVLVWSFFQAETNLVRANRNRLLVRNRIRRWC